MRMVYLVVALSASLAAFALYGRAAFLAISDIGSLPGWSVLQCLGAGAGCSMLCEHYIKKLRRVVKVLPALEDEA